MTTKQKKDPKTDNLGNNNPEKDPDLEDGEIDEDDDCVILLQPYTKSKPKKKIIINIGKKGPSKASSALKRDSSDVEVVKNVIKPVGINVKELPSLFQNVISECELGVEPIQKEKVQVEKVSSSDKVRSRRSKELSSPENSKKEERRKSPDRSHNTKDEKRKLSYRVSSKYDDRRSSPHRSSNRSDERRELRYRVSSKHDDRRSSPDRSRSKPDDRASSPDRSRSRKYERRESPYRARSKNDDRGESPDRARSKNDDRRESPYRARGRNDDRRSSSDRSRDKKDDRRLSPDKGHSKKDEKSGSPDRKVCSPLKRHNSIQEISSTDDKDGPHAHYDRHDDSVQNTHKESVNFEHKTSEPQHTNSQESGVCKNCACGNRQTPLALQLPTTNDIQQMINIPNPGNFPFQAPMLDGPNSFLAGLASMGINPFFPGFMPNPILKAPDPENPVTLDPNTVAALLSLMPQQMLNLPNLGYLFSQNFGNGLLGLGSPPLQTVPDMSQFLAAQNTFINNFNVPGPGSPVPLVSPIPPQTQHVRIPTPQSEPRIRIRTDILENDSESETKDVADNVSAADYLNTKAETWGSSQPVTVKKEMETVVNHLPPALAQTPCVVRPVYPQALNLPLPLPFPLTGWGAFPGTPLQNQNPEVLVQTNLIESQDITTTFLTENPEVASGTRAEKITKRRISLQGWLESRNKTQNEEEEPAPPGTSPSKNYDNHMWKTYSESKELSEDPEKAECSNAVSAATAEPAEPNSDTTLNIWNRCVEKQLSSKASTSSETTSHPTLEDLRSIRVQFHQPDSGHLVNETEQINDAEDWVVSPEKRQQRDRDYKTVQIRVPEQREAPPEGTRHRAEVHRTERISDSRNWEAPSERTRHSVDIHRTERISDSENWEASPERTRHRVGVRRTERISDSENWEASPERIRHHVGVRRTERIRYSENWEGSPERTRHRVGTHRNGQTSDTENWEASPERTRQRLVARRTELFSDSEDWEVPPERTRKRSREYRTRAEVIGDSEDWKEPMENTRKRSRDYLITNAYIPEKRRSEDERRKSYVDLESDRIKTLDPEELTRRWSAAAVPSHVHSIEPGRSERQLSPEKRESSYRSSREPRKDTYSLERERSYRSSRDHSPEGEMPHGYSRDHRRVNISPDRERPHGSSRDLRRVNILTEHERSHGSSHDHRRVNMSAERERPHGSSRDHRRKNISPERERSHTSSRDLRRVNISPERERSPGSFRVSRRVEISPEREMSYGSSRDLRRDENLRAQERSHGSSRVSRRVEISPEREMSYGSSRDRRRDENLSEQERAYRSSSDLRRGDHSPSSRRYSSSSDRKHYAGSIRPLSSCFNSEAETWESGPPPLMDAEVGHSQRHDRKRKQNWSPGPERPKLVKSLRRRSPEAELPSTYYNSEFENWEAEGDTEQPVKVRHLERPVFVPKEIISDAPIRVRSRPVPRSTYYVSGVSSRGGRATSSREVELSGPKYYNTEHEDWEAEAPDPEPVTVGVAGGPDDDLDLVFDYGHGNNPIVKLPPLKPLIQSSGQPAPVPGTARPVAEPDNRDSFNWEAD